MIDQPNTTTKNNTNIDADSNSNNNNYVNYKIIYNKTLQSSSHLQLSENLKLVDYLDLIVDKRIDCYNNYQVTKVDQSSQTLETQIIDIMTSTTELDQQTVDEQINEEKEEDKEVSEPNNVDINNPPDPTISSDCKHEMINEQEPDNMDESKKVAPKRPPPPCIKCDNPQTVPTIVKNGTKPKRSPSDTKTMGYKRVKHQFTLTEKMYILKSNTVDFSKKLKKQISNKEMPFNRHNILKKSKSVKETNREKKMEDQVVTQSVAPVSAASASEPDQLQKSEKSTPPQRTYQSFKQRKSIKDILQSENSVFESYRIIDKLKNVLMEDSDEEADALSTTLSNLLVHEASTAFQKTVLRQIRDKIAHCNSALSQCLDLDSQGLTLACHREIEHHRKWNKACCHQEVYTVNWLPGWKHLRLVEENNSGRQFIILKTAMSKLYLNLCGHKMPKQQTKWFGLPISNINTLKNEMEFINKLEEQNVKPDFVLLYRNLLRMVLLIALIRFYESGPKDFSRKLDADKVLLINSECGFLVIFHDAFNDTEEELPNAVFSSDCISEIPQELENLEMDLFNKFKPFFTNTHIIQLFISSLWPLDSLLYVIVDNVLRRAYESGELHGNIDSSDDDDEQDDNSCDSDDNNEEEQETNVFVEINDDTVDKDNEIKEEENCDEKTKEQEETIPQLNEV